MKTFTLQDLEAAYKAGGNVTFYNDFGYDTKWKSFDEWYNYNYPEVKDDKDMIKNIDEAFVKINADLLYKTYVNDKSTRTYTKLRLEALIPGSRIKCDEENNSPDVIDSNNLLARVFWEGEENSETKYIDLIFGRPEQIFNF